MDLTTLSEKFTILFAAGENFYKGKDGKLTMHTRRSKREDIIFNPVRPIETTTPETTTIEELTTEETTTEQEDVTTDDPCMDFILSGSGGVHSKMYETVKV